MGVMGVQAKACLDFAVRWSSILHSGSDVLRQTQQTPHACRYCLRLLYSVECTHFVPDRLLV